MNLNELPVTAMDSVFVNLKTRELLRMKTINKDLKDKIDAYLLRAHYRKFGPSDKPVQKKIKDLLLSDIFSKLQSRLRYVNYHDFESYGVGDIFGTITAVSELGPGQPNLLSKCRITRNIVFTGPKFESIVAGKIRVADDFSREFPHLADQVRIATHHFINKLQAQLIAMVELDKANTVRRVYRELRMSQGPEGRRKLDMYRSDLTLPNPGFQVRTAIYDEFYNLRHWWYLNVDDINGLRPGLPLKINNLRSVHNIADIATEQNISSYFQCRGSTDSNPQCQALINWYRTTPERGEQEGPVHWDPFRINELLSVAKVYERNRHCIGNDPRLDQSDKTLLAQFLNYKMLPYKNSTPVPMQQTDTLMRYYTHDPSDPLVQSVVKTP
jgi:hypothetical protein